MKYLGGKAKLARHITPFIDAELCIYGDYLEPFVGGFNIVPCLKCNFGRVVCSDIHRGLIRLYQALQSGYEPVTFVSEAEYKLLKLLGDDDDPATALVGFGSSFGGKEWGGYARGRAANGAPRNYAAEASSLLKRKLPAMRNVEFAACSYQSHAPKSCVVYCDPPYAQTTGYKTGSFNHAEFYQWCEDAARRDCAVFVSEFTAPSHWSVVWEKSRAIAVSGTKEGHTRVERLYRV